MTTEFNFEQFKAGRPAITRAGTKAFFVGYDPAITEYPPVIYRTESGGIMGVYPGGFVEAGETGMMRPGDLVAMGADERTIWLNVFDGTFGIEVEHFDTKALAEAAAQDMVATKLLTVAAPFTFTVP